MAIELVTGKQGAPHVTSYQAGAMQQVLVGGIEQGSIDGSNGLVVGKYFHGFSFDEYEHDFPCVMIDAEAWQIHAGTAFMQGRFIATEPGNVETLSIASGVAGYKRCDVIYMQYEKKADGTESVKIDTLGGAQGNTWVKPKLQQGELSENLSTCINQSPMYYIYLDGTRVDHVEDVCVTVDGLMNKANTNHASSGVSYGVGDAQNYGHVKVVNNLTTSSYNSAQPVVLSAMQGKVLNDNITNSISDIHSVLGDELNESYTPSLVFPIKKTTASNMSDITVTRKNNVVTISGQCSTDFTYLGTESVLMFTLPAKYRPSGVKYCVNTATGYVISRFIISPAGNVYLEWVRKLSDGTNLSGTVSWLAIEITYLVD